MAKTTLIFDIGNVLMRWQPLQLAAEMHQENPAFPLEIGEIPQTKEWEDLDRGVLKLSQVAQCYSSRYPREHIDEFLKRGLASLSPIQSGWNLFFQAKKTRKKVYLLSNLSFEFRDFLLSKFPDLLLADGAVFSCDINSIKPEHEIYQTLLLRYQISSEDALFFDDKEENIRAANQLGIQGELFTHSC